MLRRGVEGLRAEWVWRYLVGPLPFVVVLAAFSMHRLGAEQIGLPALMILLYFLPQTKRAYPYLFPFVFFWCSYDTLRVLTPVFQKLNTPFVASPYHIEHALFSIPYGGHWITLNEFFQTHTSLIVDLAAAFAYAFYFYEAFILAFYLLAKNRPLLRRFGIAFILLNYITFITWYTVPVAPPWYVELYGLGPADLKAPPSAARLLEVDDWLGFPYFHDLYAKAANVFGALPSLHSAWPLLVWLYARKHVRPVYAWTIFAYWLLVAFSAVYLRHHYVIDIVLGCSYALLVYLVVEHYNRKWYSAAAAL
ncbi:MAG: inositol phosphorylceramide synthase [Clostridia bacterium]|nr:inositol phosphorylceramide synthase [Deltaproteobacteria bacterium]